MDGSLHSNNNNNHLLRGSQSYSPLTQDNTCHPIDIVTDLYGGLRDQPIASLLYSSPFYHNTTQSQILEFDLLTPITEDIAAVRITSH